jgi:DNA-binding SARP family transcriptional activator
LSIRIQLLGQVELVRAGAKVELPAKKTLALLAVLALRPGVPFEREWLAALLWPDVSEAQARTSLRQALGHLRKALAPELVVGGADRVHVDPAFVRVDTAEVDQLLRRPPSEREALTELWRGPLLDAFPALEQPFADWLANERAVVAERVGTGLEECLAALSAADQGARAIAVGTKLLAIDPTREATHRALMRLYADGGDKPQALRQYERCRESLARELGLKPSLETEKLRKSLIDSESAPPETRPPSSLSLVADGKLTLAIVPFEFDESDAEARVLGQTLCEDLATELARFRPLAVVSRASVAAVLEKTRVPEVLARETSAKLVLSGSVRRALGRSRVTACLIDGKTGLEIWAERWEVLEEDPFSAVDKLTRSVVGALALSIDRARLGQARKRPRERLEVYECWLRGLECLRRGSEQSDEEARSFFEQALSLSPTFGRAHAGISLSHFNDWSCQAWERWDERERLAFEHARRAVELDDDDHVTHFILARIHVYRREFELGERHLEQALALNSNDADMLMHAAVAFSQLGEGERAVALADDAMRLNPKHPDWYYAIAAFPRLVCRDHAEVRRLALKAPDGFVDTRALLAIACAHAGQEAEAREHAARFMAHFREKIAPGGEASTSEARDWLLKVNPLRRASDVELFNEGLSRAGLG